MKKIILVLVALGLAAVIQSCYPGDSLGTTETDTITTFVKKDADFSQINTYAMPDSVAFITNDGVGVSGNRSFDETVLNAIDRNMAALGFQKVSDPNTADVHVLPMATTTEWSGGTCYPSYGWCYWYCYPGWCYPVTYTYTTGTILMTMLNPNQGGNNATADADALWLAAINGLLTNSPSNQRINERIDQAFTQSVDLVNNN